MYKIYGLLIQVFCKMLSVFSKIVFVFVLNVLQVLFESLFAVAGVASLHLFKLFDTVVEVLHFGDFFPHLICWNTEFVEDNWKLFEV